MKKAPRKGLDVTKKKLGTKESEDLLRTLSGRFETHMHRHKDLAWDKVEARLDATALLSLFRMEESGGEPDVAAFDKKTGEYIFFDCSTESPEGRRSLCYDREALDLRKEHKPASSAIEMAESMGIEILSEDDYRALQKLGKFDLKTSSWLKTPEPIRKLGGAIFGDFRYNQVFIYHNGAQSYYAARGFRGLLRV